jgi:CARDB/Abnormal spindle-like microcephaly-assoc'd, ASPM-SPD-2-Hydin
VMVGQSTSQNITILNQANSIGPLTGSVGTLTAPFSVVSGGGPFNLTPGQSQTVTVSFSPAAAGAASDTLFITHNATDQASPTNVPLSGAGVTTPLPDLIVSSISGPNLSKPGGRIAIANTITNQGTQAAGNFVVNFYLSTDHQITASDIFLGKRSVKGLAAGASSGPVSTNVTIPRSVTTDSYFIGAIVDPTNVILESDEGNNTAFDPAGINVCLSLAKPKLISPKNRGTNISTTPTLTWSNVTGASTYEVQVATDSGVTNIVASLTGLTTPQWAVSPALSSGTSYFWRSRGVNLCGPGPFSTTWSFKTAP